MYINCITCYFFIIYSSFSMGSCGFSRYKIISAPGILYFGGFSKNCKSHMITKSWTSVFSNKTRKPSYFLIYLSISYDVTLILGLNQPLKENFKKWHYQDPLCLQTHICTHSHTYILHLFCSWEINVCTGLTIFYLIRLPGKWVHDWWK